MVFKLQLKSTALVLCVLVLSDQILEGLSFRDSEGGEGDDDYEGESTHPRRGGKAGKKGKDNPIGLPNGGKLPKAGGAIGNIVGTGVQTIKKGTMSGLAQALDDRFIQVDTLGNPHGGVPEDVIGLVRLCASRVLRSLYNSLSFHSLSIKNLIESHFVDGNYWPYHRIR
ncbi:unnamed protein product [Medioppia subpectinata]|uniref:Uncharacterized protein n=1 Tax=Medioppia subpectinata TaxID=1979941 RepID=A0A7R9LWV4_9ACAR|nr:unnamed protein product [Medioppia subpectinata]CAG2122374.1 unnamed protein product [Medioppia subpectinata]